MEKQEKVVLTLDSYEHGIMIRALNELRNDMLEEQRDPGPVEDVLLKTIDAPRRRGLHIPRLPLAGKARSFRRSSSPKRTRLRLGFALGAACGRLPCGGMGFGRQGFRTEPDDSVVNGFGRNYLLRQVIRPRVRS